MANNSVNNDLSQQIGKLTVSGKPKIADAPRYLPPHRKHLQGTQAPPPTPSEGSVTPTPASDTTSEKSSVTSTSVSESALKNGDKPASRFVPPHIKYAKSNTASTAPTASTTSSPSSASTAVFAAPVEPTSSKNGVAESWDEEVASDILANEPVVNNSTAERESSATSATIPVTQTESKTSAPKSGASSTFVPPHIKYRSAAPSPPSRNGSTTPPSTSERRPEKTNAVAHRLIAGALGVKVPRRTEEQRAYDKAIREQEKKKRDQGREARKKADEEAARAKISVWED